MTGGSGEPQGSVIVIADRLGTCRGGVQPLGMVLFKGVLGMTAILLDGNSIANELKQELKPQIDQLTNRGIQPGLHVILVGNNPASEVYVRAKQRTAAEIGIESFVHRLPNTASQQDMLALIDRLNKSSDVHGILVQLPLPKQMDVAEIIRSIDPAKDVDGFHPVNVGNMQVGQEALLPCTPFGILQLLKRYQIELTGKNVVIVGHSHIVGRPAATLLLNENATVSVCHAYTKNLKEMTQIADILIVAVGKKHLIRADMVKPGAVVIDVGINREENRIFGDCDFDELREVASYMTPVPGGVGPMTIAMLMVNTVKAASQQVNRLAVG